jgi:hypothetical protein
MMIWTIQYLGPPSCWIAERKGTSMAFDVTFQRGFARHFANEDEANHEILRLGLSGKWFAAQIGDATREH